jgi:hypothetical protein
VIWDCEHAFTEQAVVLADNNRREFKMRKFNQLSNLVPSLTGNSIRASKRGANRETPASSYMSMLVGPMSVLACNVADRADVTTVAILGYN